MDTAYKKNLEHACKNKMWTFEDCEIGVKINGVKLDTLKELDEYIEAHA